MGPNHMLPQELASNAMVLLGETLIVGSISQRTDNQSDYLSFIFKNRSLEELAFRLA